MNSRFGATPALTPALPPQNQSAGVVRVPKEVTPAPALLARLCGVSYPLGTPAAEHPLWTAAEAGTAKRPRSNRALSGAWHVCHPPAPERVDIPRNQQLRN